MTVQYSTVQMQGVSPRARRTRPEESTKRGPSASGALALYTTVLYCTIGLSPACGESHLGCAARGQRRGQRGARPRRGVGIGDGGLEVVH